MDAFSHRSAGGRAAQRISNKTAAVLAAVCVVLIIVLVWVLVRNPRWGNLDYWTATLRESPDEVYARSAGGADEEACLALDRTQARLDNPRIRGVERLADQRRLLHILRLSILPSLNGVQDHGARMQRLQAQVRETIARNRQEMAADLAREIPGIQRDRAQALATARRRADLQPDPVFYITEILAADALDRNGLLNFAGADAGGAVAGPQPGIFNTIHATSSRLNAENAAARRSAATDATADQAQAANLYLDMAQTHTNDRENSHDPAVSAAIRVVAERLRADPFTRDAAAKVSLESIAADFREHVDEYTRDPRTGRPRPLILENDVLPVIERARGGESISIAAAGRDGARWRMTDAELLRLVWARSMHPHNASNAQKMRDALFWGLADCWNKGMAGPHIVCVQGRMGRMAGSLALLDFDADNWAMTRLEDVRNEILESARAAMAAAAAALAGDESESAGVREAARAYCAPPVLAPAFDVEPSEEDDARVKERLTAAMVAVAEQRAADINRRVPGAVRPEFVDGIKEELRWVII